MSMASALGRPSTGLVLVTATPFVRRHLVPQERVCTVLGRFPTALYLELDHGTVIAVLTSDAVMLPVGLVLPTSSAQTPLDDECNVEVGEGEIRLGTLTIVAARERSARLQPVGTPRPDRIAEALRLLMPLFERTTLPLADVHELTRARSFDGRRRAVRALLGRGPGLTPAGDDVLAGVLAGAVLVDRDAGELRRVVLSELAQRPRATTSLARQLLERACDGEIVPQAGALGAALCGDSVGSLQTAVSRLLTIGHSSGVALAFGVTVACELS